MSLQAKVDALKADFEAGRLPFKVSRSMLDTMHRATAELIASGAADRALKPGDAAPTFLLADPAGNHRRLLEPIGNIPPAEAEDQYYAAASKLDMAA
jgi:hypothetical protein